jgi:D-arabinose 1-dehydrogenase-like Zn-dependent alcohol dehydrogenase
VVERYGDELVLRELPLPAAESGALLVRVAATTVCGSDANLWQGHYEKSLAVELPFVAGHEIVGRVSGPGYGPGYGAGVDSIGQVLHVGDRVIWAPPPCRRCYTCTVRRMPTLCPHKRMGMLTSCDRFPFVGGGLTSHSYVYPNSGRIRVPDEVKTEWACVASCAVRTAVSVLREAGPSGRSTKLSCREPAPSGCSRRHWRHCSRRVR